MFFWTTSLSRSFGIVMRASTWALSSSAAFSATSLRLLPSKLNGLVTTPIVSAPESFAIWATTGAAPRPVPPPRPAVMNTMSESASAAAIFSESSSAERWPIGRVAAGAEAARDLVADADLVRRVRLEERLRIGVAGDELHAHHLGPDHPVDGVAAAAPDPDDADKREVLGIGTQRHRALLRQPSRASNGGTTTVPDLAAGSRHALARDGGEYTASAAGRGASRETRPPRWSWPQEFSRWCGRRTVGPAAASLVVSVRLQPVAFGAERGGNGAPAH